ncbi:hypothetical protein AVEN_260498-1 [Araneus ventricosus]|uniref:Transmembrane protein n=1 Tax=Araneus ventricosus TaxID=182803 RepID=A0A4Y2QMD2_ARAVE|nr:hypothetical protein AVEN_260498-1 [Araneus ventricosus]
MKVMYAGCDLWRVAMGNVSGVTNVPYRSGLCVECEKCALLEWAMRGVRKMCLVGVGYVWIAKNLWQCVKCDLWLWVMFVVYVMEVGNVWLASIRTVYDASGK